VIGDVWIFPARRGNPGGCLTGDAVCNLWKRLAAAAKVPSGERYGWHALRRQFANELRTTNLKDLTALGGWKSAETVIRVYMKPDQGDPARRPGAAESVAGWRCNLTPKYDTIDRPGQIHESRSTRERQAGHLVTNQSDRTTTDSVRTPCSPRPCDACRPSFSSHCLRPWTPRPLRQPVSPPSTSRCDRARTA